MKLDELDIVEIIKETVLRSKILGNTYKKQHPNSKYSLDEIIREIIYVLKSGVSWRQVRGPVKPNTLFWHFNRFNRHHIFRKSFSACRRRILKDKYNLVIVDTTLITNKYGRNKISRNRLNKNKKCTKISAITDQNGIPLTIFVDKGSRHDLKFVIPHVNKIKKRLSNNTILLADKGYVSHGHLKRLSEKNVQLMVMKKKNMKTFGNFDKALYKKRIFVEHFFQRLKRFRRLQVRYETDIQNYRGFIYLASIFSM